MRSEESKLTRGLDSSSIFSPQPPSSCPASPPSSVLTPQSSSPTTAAWPCVASTPNPARSSPNPPSNTAQPPTRSHQRPLSPSPTRRGAGPSRDEAPVAALTNMELGKMSRNSRTLLDLRPRGDILTSDEEAPARCDRAECPDEMTIDRAQGKRKLIGC